MQSFESVAEDVRNWNRPNELHFNQLHGLFKQATEGDAIATSAPDVSDTVAYARWKTWADLAGMSKDTAKQRYIEKALELRPLYTKSTTTFTEIPSEKLRQQQEQQTSSIQETRR